MEPKRHMEPKRRRTLHDQVAALAASIRDLESQISTSNTSGTPLPGDDALRSLEDQLNEQPSFAGFPTASCCELDSAATALWNTCAQASKAREKNEEALKLLSRARALAFAVLDIAAPARPSVGHLRALKAALKAARGCLGTPNLYLRDLVWQADLEADSEQLDLSLKVLGAGAQRLDSLENSNTQMDKSHLQSVATEYYMLRIQLAWLRGRPDIAEHLLSKAPAAVMIEDRKIITETCYNVGNAALSASQYDIAVQWLSRASEQIDILDSESHDHLGAGLNDLKLLVRHTLVRAYMCIDTPESREALTRQLTLLKADAGDTPSVLFLELEILCRGEKPDRGDGFKGTSSVYCRLATDINHVAALLTDIVSCMNPSDENLRLAFYYIENHTSSSLDFTVHILQSLLVRLLPFHVPAWVERCFLSLVWLLRSSNEKCLELIRDMIKKLETHGHSPLSMGATHATLIVIWKQMDSAVRKKQLAIAEKWGVLAVDTKIFESCSKSNRHKTLRKLAGCALSKWDVALAREILDRIPVSEEDVDSRTLFLCYKLALMEGTNGAELHCQEVLDTLGAGWFTYVLSCAAEAQRQNKQSELLECILCVFECMGMKKFFSHEVDLSSFFIFTFLVLKDVEDKTSREEMMCQTFTSALRVVVADVPASSTISPDDLQWLYGESYDLALRMLTESRVERVSPLLEASKEFARCYSNRRPLDRLKVSLHIFLCNYLGAIFSVKKARSESDSSIQKCHYERLHDDLFIYASVSQFLEGKDVATVEAEWLQRCRNLIALDFEASIHLELWSFLISLAEQAQGFLDEELCSSLLDLILRSHAPIQEIVTVVKTIICTAHDSSSPFLNASSFRIKLPRYLRCLFQLAITSIPREVSEISPQDEESVFSVVDASLAESVLDQVLVLASNEYFIPSAQPNQSLNPGMSSISGILEDRSWYPYPIEELEWLASVAFNKAVDFYRAARDEEYQRWGMKAVQVAESVDRVSGGVLARMLRANMERLS
ncbi:hypothetical protein N7474_011157 [Penicillium riverlandense]|uniref:uncharacterized protein n=1 Tax=Penicillium riverlandense TaxID=1903569 RepID=UPI0025487F2A|nr:uncharacterized protein N7474_011157 [Penicillium riverlandense]KAJ5805270.1 hypothetical protein N7474_011157 [Penicillium riverlandense]